MSEKIPDVVFVNTLSVSGFLNGNVNLTFTTARWVARYDPDQEKPVVIPADVESAFLRMDLHCAGQLHAALGKILADHSKPEGAIN